jgi:hypothetical protein
MMANRFFARCGMVCLGAFCFAVGSVQSAPAKKSGQKTVEKTAKTTTKTSTKLVPLKLVLPKPKFMGTPKNVPAGTTVEKPTGKPRPTFYVPVGTKNLALKKPVTSSDEYPIIGTLDLVTDGDKEADEGSWVELGPGTQWVQIDLQKSSTISAIVLWHYHGEARIYRDVVVQVSDDANFKSGVKTVFNNDQDNSSGLGAGKHREFFEMAEGKIVDAKNVKGRYVRLYSKGNTSDDQNHYTEVEIYGK